MATARLGLSTLTAGVSTRANLITYFNANMAILDKALLTNADATFNAGLGNGAVPTNTAFGVNTLGANTTGYQNVAVGQQSLYSNTTGYRNVSIGCLAGYAQTTGHNNVFVGHTVGGAVTSGSYLTLVGYAAGNTTTTGYNITAIGHNAQASTVSASNEVILGDSNVTKLRCATTTITAISDVRDKANITDLDLGLDFLKSLKPRRFTWKRRITNEDGTLGEGELGADEAGFIAQELDEAQETQGASWIGLVMKANPDRWEATPGKLLPIMVKAIQDLATENEGLRARIETLENS